MRISVRELMTDADITVAPHATVDHVRDVMIRENRGALPVVDGDNRPVGLITATDFAPTRHPETPIREIMTTRVLTIPDEADVMRAARMMRENRAIRLVVTEDDRVVGMVNAFDLLKVVEEIPVSV